MRHQPHLLIEEPWIDAELAVTSETRRHLDRVLRTSVGAMLTYTDGVGTLGTGSWSGSAVVRGDESDVRPELPAVTLGVAVPKAKERQRFIVEKCQELGVSRLVWLKTEYGEGRMAAVTKMAAWARGALEQSRGAWLMEIVQNATLSDLDDPVILDVDAAQSLSALAIDNAITLAIGPEGGFSPTEIDTVPVRVSLGTNTLRTDTAAIAAAAILRTR